MRSNDRVDAVTLAFDALDDKQGINAEAYDDIYHNVRVEFGEDVAKRLTQVVSESDNRFSLKITDSDERMIREFADENGNCIPGKEKEAIEAARNNSDRDDLEEWVLTGELPED